MKTRIWLVAALAIMAGACSSDEVSGPGEVAGPAAEPNPWHWLNPSPTIDNYSGIVSCGPVGTLIAMTGYDAFRTTDGGATWAPVAAGIDGFCYDIHSRESVAAILTEVSVRLSTDAGASWRGSANHGLSFAQGVAFVDGARGIVVGSRGSILTTEDGGRSWTPRFSGTDEQIRDVEYLDADVVFAGTNDGWVLRSLDGGTTWVSIDRLSTRPISTIDVTAGILRMIDVDGTIGTSADRGETWAISTVPGLSPYDLEFRDAVNGVASSSSPQDISVHMTSDGGINWTPASIDESVRLNGVAYESNDVLWAVGSLGDLLRSQDGGQTWAQAREGFSTQLRDVAFADETTGLAVGATDAAGLFPTYCGIWATSDGGATWTRPRIGNSNNLCQARDLNAVAMLDPMRAVIVGDEGDLWTTADGSVTWVQRDAKTSLNLYDVAYGDESTLIVVGDFGQIRYSHDAGTTWTAPVGGAGTDNALFAVSFASPQVAMLVGYGDVISRTEDAGVSWSDADAGVSATRLFDIVMLDEMTAVVVGSQGEDTSAQRASARSGTVVFGTTDGGVSWQEQSIASAANGGAMAFGSRSNGYIVTTNGRFFTTNDGGVNWVQQLRPTGRSMRGVYAVDANTAFLVGERGSILRTTSWGQ